MNKAELIKALAELLAEKMEIGEEPTNGEVIQTLFPIERIYKEEYVEVVFKRQYHTTYFTFDFWNAPYKAERGET